MNSIEYGFIFGIMLIFLGVSIMLNFYFWARRCQQKFTDNWYRRKLIEVEKAHKGEFLELISYRDQINANWQKNKVLPEGFQRCPNPKMIKPKESK